uniref:Uncharacterized protein n=1 Tax=Amphimedon queenslandica TaxID=400682 RepID=A0A1X7T4E8_AMPQE
MYYCITTTIITSTHISITIIVLLFNVPLPRVTHTVSIVAICLQFHYQRSLTEYNK